MATEVVPYEEMGPLTLSEQPVRVAGPQKGDPDWDDVFAYVESRRAILFNWRSSWLFHWSQLAEFILPRRYHWIVVPNQFNRGSEINNAIIDSTATLAMETCSSGLWSGLTSPSRPWAALEVRLPWMQIDAAGQEWLEDTTKRLFVVLGQSNFYTAMAQFFQDVVTFGTAVIIIYPDREDGIRVFNPALGEFYLGAGARLSVDTMYREFSFTIMQIVDMFGLENCPEQVRALWENGKMDQELVVCHAIEPNSPIARKGSALGSIQVVPEDFPFRELYWLKGNKTEAPLSKRGFEERPFMVGRWATVSNDPYGRGPGMNALGDVKQVQVSTRRKGEFIEKGIRPPLGANPELKNEPSSILPGHITYTNTTGGQKGMWPLFEVNPAFLPALVEDIQQVEQRIERAFFVDVFMAITRMEGVQPRNELELTKRDLERLQALGPFIERFENEVASPAIQRVLAIMERRKMLKPPPPSMHGIGLKVSYNSIIRQAQRASETVVMKDVMQTMGALSAAAKAAALPDPLRIAKLDVMARRYAELSKFPMDALYTEEEVAKADKLKAKMTQQMMQQQQMLQATTAGVQAAKTLSDTPLGQGSALDAMMGRGGS